MEQHAMNRIWAEHELNKQFQHALIQHAAKNEMNRQILQQAAQNKFNNPNLEHMALPGNQPNQNHHLMERVDPLAHNPDLVDRPIAPESEYKNDPNYEFLQRMLAEKDSFTAAKNMETCNVTLVLKPGPDNHAALGESRLICMKQK